MPAETEEALKEQAFRDRPDLLALRTYIEASKHQLRSAIGLKPVDIGDVELTERQGAERRSKVALDDASVVSRASLPGGPGLEPVVAEVGDGLSAGHRRAFSAPDLERFELMASKRQFGVLAPFVDLALASTRGIELTNAPLVAMLGGPGHLPCSYLEQGRRGPETNRPFGSGRVVWPQNGPKMAPENKTRTRSVSKCASSLVRGPDLN